MGKAAGSIARCAQGGNPLAVGKLQAPVSLPLPPPILPGLGQVRRGDGPVGSMRLLGGLLCCGDLLCPIRSSFKFAFFQWTFRPLYKEPFTRNSQLSSSALELICDRLCSIAKYFHQRRQYARINVIH